MTVDTNYKGDKSLTAQHRNFLFDFLKGVGAVLVVLGHSIQFGSGEMYYQNQLFWDEWLYKVIYSFHMPLFAMISGYLFFYSLDKHGYKATILKWIYTLLIPLFAWSFIETAVQLVSGMILNFPKVVFVEWFRIFRYSL